MTETVELTPELLAKRDRLLEVLCNLGRVAVAFSGGIDSTVVAKAARLALGDRAVAVTADSASVPRSELAEAAELARRVGIRHVVVSTQEFDNPDYLRNDGSRCYHCKSELYSQVESILPGVNEKWLLGIFTASDGHADPIATCRAYTAALRARGVQVCEGVPVQQITSAGGSVTGVTTPIGELKADVVVLAAGSGSARLLHLRQPRGAR